MIRMAHLSDLHFGSEIPNVTEALLEAVGEISPDVVVISGDFTMAGRRSEYRSAAEFVSRIRAPVVATPGNHDIPAYALWERFTNPLGRYQEWISPIAYTKYSSASVAPPPPPPPPRAQIPCQRSPARRRVPVQPRAQHRHRRRHHLLR